jgi:hypothetical protein
MCFCWALTVKPGLLSSQDRRIFVLAMVLLFWIIPLNVWVFRTLLELQPDLEAVLILPSRLKLGGGNIGGDLTNHSD